MNKKFSTLVAALLVSGGSLVVASQYMGSPLMSSPLAVAAAANLRAATPAVVSMQSGVFATEGNNASTQWNLADGKIKTKNGGILSVKGDDVILWNQGYKAETGATELTFTYVDDHFETTTSGSVAKVLAFDRTTHELSLQVKDGFDASEYNYATAFANPTTQANNLASSFYIGEEISVASVGDKAAKVTTASTLSSEGVTYTGGIASSVNAAGIAKAEVVAYSGDSDVKLLKITTAGGSVCYLNGGATRLTANEPGTLEVAASVVAVTEQGYITIGGKHLEYNAGTLELQGTHPNNSAVYLYKSGETDVVKTTLPTTGEFVLVNFNDDANLTNDGGNAVKVTATGAEVLANTGADEATTLTASKKTAGKFMLGKGNDFLSATGTLVEKIAAGEFTLSGVDGAIMVGEKYLVQTIADGALSVLEAGFNTETYKSLYLYDASGEDLGSPVTTVPTTGSFVLATARFAEPELTGNYALTTTETHAVPDVTPDVPSGLALDLTDGAKYTISGGTYSLNINANGEGLTGVTTGAQYWIVTKYENAGQQTYYSFTNAANGKALAFSASRSDDGTWTVDYDKDGDYNKFFVNQKGEICFTVSATYKEGGVDKVDTENYELNINSATPLAEVYVTQGEGDQNTFTKATAAPVENVDDAVEKLNEVLGTGNGFSVMFKNMAITEDKVKDITLESNPFSDATLIKAVAGPKANDISDLRATDTRTDLSGAMFLKVSGSYPLTPEQLDAKGADNDKKKAAAQVDAFRSSTFIAVDTVAYTKDEEFFKYVTVSGSSMLSYKGYVFTDGAAEDDFKRSKNLEGVTRRIENAQFTLQQVPGGTVTEAIQLVAAAWIPSATNGEKVALLGHTTAKNATQVTDLNLAVKTFNGKNYLGAGAAPVEAYKYVYVGSNNDVDYKTINGIVTLISRNYNTDGQVYATAADFPVTETNRGIVKVLPKYVSTDKPEGQYLVTGGYAEGGIFHPFVFTNRESGKWMSIDGLKKTDKANVYADIATGDTIEIKAASTANEFVGYANYDADVLANTQYVLKVVSNAAGIKDIYIAEDHNKDHSLGLNADTLEAANFKLIKFEAAADMAKFKDYGDTVFVSREEDKYSYVAVDKKTKEEYYDVAEDRVVAFTYAIYNADNNEFLAVKDGQGTTVAEYFYCDPNLKYNGNNADKARRFIIKEKANGAVQLIPVDIHNRDFVGNNRAPEKVQFQANALSKLYAGISDNKLNAQDPIYLLTDNDLFTIQQIGAPLYRTLDVTGNVRIYKEGMPNIALFAESADKALVSGQNLLGMEHKADADLNKTMFSFLLDTAYVNRANNYTPQYLLAIDATVTPGGKWCETHQSATCEHAVETAGYVKGSYLVSLADSAAAVAASQAHKNPYRYDGYNRLGFVKATHIGDKLAIERAKAVKADTLDLTGMTKASFALRIVDQATKSFALQTNGGYMKWLNGVPVLVNDFAQAEVLNIESTENAATENEAIAAEGVQVISGKGAITVQGAAGKVITVADILGRTIANQVAASDNVTIAAPAGIAVVTVDGEATKVVVK